MLVNSPAEMLDLGQKIGTKLSSSDVVVLTGELGAGKTLLTQGIGKALGFTHITSPTFVLSRIHKGSPNLVHVDAYRLLDAPRNSFSDLDLFGYLESSVFVIEWGIDFVDQLSESFLEIVINQNAKSDQREVSINTFGKRWQGFKL